MASPTPDEDDAIDPGLNNTNTNKNENGQPAAVAVPKRYNLLIAGGASVFQQRAIEFGREEDLKGSEYVYFLLPREVLVWGWDFDISRGFGRGC